MLAIMGILAMVGMKAYTMAVTKHKANELIYEAQKRAASVAMQITAGRNGLSIAEFTNPTGYTFGVEKNPYNANQFNITIDAVDSDVCAQMQNAAGAGTSLRVISSNCTTLTFNNDLSITEYPSDYNTNKGLCNANGFKSCVYGDNGIGRNCLQSGADCCVGIDYDSKCQTCQAANGAISNTTLEGSSCIYTRQDSTTTTGICKSGMCVDADVTAGTACTSNDQCGGTGSGYYCAITYDESTNLNVASVNNTETACYKNLTGTCTLLNAATRQTVSERALLTQAGFPPTLVRGPALNWWSANNWCQAQGKHLLNVSEIDCHRKTSNPATNNTVVQAAENWAYCCKNGQACLQESWDTTLWNGKNILTGKGEEVAKFADKIVALRKAFGNNYLWTASPYGNTSQNSCYAFGVGPKIGYVYSLSRYKTYTPLCE